MILDKNELQGAQKFLEQAAEGANFVSIFYNHLSYYISLVVLYITCYIIYHFL